ncbi:MAG TPA: hypothetical protein ENL22_04550 [candidate division Zixibacteria bacterium]|nr:hypothetical protein [candidate division Zixibacteria bacterium]
MRKVVALMFVLMMTLFRLSGAIELESSRFELNVESLKNSGADYLESSEFLAQEETLNIEENDKSIYEYTYKSPKKAFLYSLLIPGWGQKYAGSSIIKTAGFLLVEVGSWAGHFTYQKKGDDKTIEFKTFVDVHWIEGDTAIILGDNPPDEAYQTYRGWIYINYNGIVEDTGFTEHLPSTKTQQYYEMIGKYDQFRGGWDDYWTGDTATVYLTEHRRIYMDMRKKANDYLNNANTMIIVSILNHLISAFDAAISANRHNKQFADDAWSIKAEVKSYSATEKIPMIKITYRF